MSMDTDDTNHVMTNNILVSRAFIAIFARFVKRSVQKIRHELKLSAAMNHLMETGSGNNCRYLVAVSPQQKSTINDCDAAFAEHIFRR